MNTQHPIEFSNIAELVFFQDPALKLPRLISDLEAALEGVRRLGPHLGGQSDSHWWTEFSGIRVVMALYDAPRRGVATSLTLCVGPAPRAALNAPYIDHAALAERLLGRLQGRVYADQCHWLRHCAPVAAPAALAPFSPPPSLRPAPTLQAPVMPVHPVRLPLGEDTIASVMEQISAPENRARIVALDSDDAAEPATSMRDEDLLRLREALYAAEEVEVVEHGSNQMRLAIHTMNATLIVVALPVGAAMLTYSLIRGDNLRATASALVATGVGIAMLQGPLIQGLLSFAG